MAWQLADVSNGDSGFATITGSRESCETTSSDVRSLEDGLGLVVQPEIEVGDLLFFKTLAHGTLPWYADHECRSVLYKYTSRGNT